MKKTLQITLALLALKYLANAADIPAGLFGYPLGTYLTISGQTPTGRMVKSDTASTLVVTNANGKAIDPPIFLVVENLGAQYFPSNTAITIRGYETGKMVGSPIDPAMTENMAAPQAVWHFRRTFILTTSINPLHLPVREADDAYMNRRQERLDATK